MDKKYYTPNIREFRYSFQYEVAFDNEDDIEENLLNTSNKV